MVKSFSCLVIQRRNGHSLSIKPSQGARGEALSLFRFHLSPFRPETPDTQAKTASNHRGMLTQG